MNTYRIPKKFKSALIIFACFISLASFLHLNYQIAPSLSKVEEMQLQPNQRVLTDIKTIKLVVIKIYEFVSLTQK
jgi:hypothetical protein